ncbi:GNAT family N-acetyltransferase [Planktothrix mougeotii]|uniref:GNAT family N-acetyltransferase n=1 Tax=Planktothrix mougeotii LEGE 06226 TaxID=1828728 RepID=A0ABR9UJU5_9CYAN|nr:GNAT family N-acetyltransferase [Planktothrix mougeotii]MBE9146753.1 GNAT family N-acetyltransferase [Planktothrix mougeotii LEGE 06226]
MKFTLGHPSDKRFWNAAIKMLGTHANMQWVLQGALSKYQAITELEHWEQHWEKYGFGNYFALDRQGKELLGFVKVYHSDRSPFVNIGYALDQPYWGHGLGTELAETALKIGFLELKEPQLVGFARCRNHASRRILEKVGFHQVKECLIEDRDYCLYQISQERYLQRLEISAMTYTPIS